MQRNDKTSFNNNGLNLLTKLDRTLQSSNRSQKPTPAAVENFKDFVSLTHIPLNFSKLAFNSEGNIILYFKRDENEMTIRGENLGEVVFTDTDFSGYYGGNDFSVTKVHDLVNTLASLYKRGMAEDLENRRKRLLDELKATKEVENESETV